MARFLHLCMMYLSKYHFMFASRSINQNDLPEILSSFLSQCCLR